jgi:hypothetical protein
MRRRSLPGRRRRSGMRKTLAQLTPAEQAQLATIFTECQRRQRHPATEVVSVEDPPFPNESIDYDLCAACAAKMRAVLETDDAAPPPGRER